MHSPPSILELLQHLGLTHYWSHFHRHGINVRHLAELSLADLISIGINNASHRLVLLRSARHVIGLSQPTGVTASSYVPNSDPPQLPRRAKAKVHSNRSVPIVPNRIIDHSGFYAQAQSRISDWSNTIPSHEFHDLGRRIQITKVDLFPIYVYALKTQYEQRAIFEGSQRADPNSIPFFNIWKQPVRHPNDWKEETHRFALLNDSNESLNHEIGIRYHSIESFNFWKHPDIPEALLTTGGMAPSLFQTKIRRPKLQRQTSFDQLPNTLQRQIIESDPSKHLALLSRYTGDLRPVRLKRIFGHDAPEKLFLRGTGFVFKSPFVEIYGQKIAPWKLILLDIHRQMGVLRRVTRKRQKWDSDAKIIRRGLKQALDMRRHLRFEWEQLPYSSKEINRAIYTATKALVSKNRIWFCNRWWTVEDLSQSAKKNAISLGIVPEALRPVLLEIAKIVIVKTAAGSPFPGNSTLTYDENLAINNIMDSDLIHAISIEDRNIRTNLLQKIESQELQRVAIEMIDESLPNSDSRYVKQRLDVHMMPVHRVQYRHDGQLYSFWLFGKELRYWATESPIHSRFNHIQRIARECAQSYPDKTINLLSKQLTMCPNNLESYDIRHRALSVIWRQLRNSSILAFLLTTVLGGMAIVGGEPFQFEDAVKITATIPVFILAYMGLASWFYRAYIDGGIPLNKNWKRWLTPMLIPLGLLLTFQLQSYLKDIDFNEEEVQSPAPTEAIQDAVSLNTFTCLEKDLASKSCADLELSRNEIHARNGFVFKRKDLANHFNAQSWYLPVSSVETNMAGYTEQEKLCLNQIYRWECNRCNICMQDPSTPENTIQFQTISEVFASSDIVQKNEQSTLSDEMYPIGFTKDGSVFAYVKFEANESMNCSFWSLESHDTQNMTLNKHSTWTDHQETECLASPASAFEKHRMLFLRKLTNMGIQQQDIQKINAFPLIMNDSKHHVRITPKSIKRLQGRVQEIFEIKHFKENKYVKSIGILPKTSYGGTSQIMGHSVVGYLLNPQKTHMLVFIKQRQKGFLQPPDINRMLMFSMAIEQPNSFK